jgi:hypothetical protein
MLDEIGGHWVSLNVGVILLKSESADRYFPQGASDPSENPSPVVSRPTTGED